MTSLASTAPAWRRWWRIIPVLFLLGTLVAPTAPAHAHPVCQPFDYVSVGKLPHFTGTVSVIIPEADVRGQVATVVGKYLTTSINLETLTVSNLTLKGVADPTSLTPKDWQLITGPAPAPPESSPPPPAAPPAPPGSPPDDASNTRSGVAYLQGAVVLHLSPTSGVSIERGSVAQTMKIQAKNCTQGEVVTIQAGQMTTTTIDVGVGAGLQYGQDEYGRTLFNTGPGATPTPPSYTYQLNRHEMNGRISEAGATRTGITRNSSRWMLTPNGRIGIVLGEEALEYTLQNGKKVDARTCIFIVP
jgi:hypothetical protein